MSEEAAIIENTMGGVIDGSPEYHTASTNEDTTLKRRNAVAGKAPMMDYCMEEEEEAIPDLAEFFDQFELELDAQIKICRAYASYLVSMMPRKPRKKQKNME